MAVMKPHWNPRQSISVLAISVALLAAACGSGTSPDSDVASLDSTGGDSASTTVAPADSQEALLQYAACMRENGVDMADPTFDADGNPTGGGFGPRFRHRPGSDEFQTAQTACGDLLEGVTLGGQGRNGIDAEAIQNSLSDFTACLRDEGPRCRRHHLRAAPVAVPVRRTNRRFGPGGRRAASVAHPRGGAPSDGGAGPGGEGFDPTARMIEQLGLDDTTRP